MQEKERPPLEHLPDERLNELVEFLYPFHKHTLSLQSEQMPTAPLPLLTKTALSEHTRVLPEEEMNLNADGMISLKRASKFIEEKIKPTIEQKAATLLTPRYRQLGMLNDNDRDEVRSIFFTHALECL